MKIDRLFGIVFFLLDKRHVTASQLAERFGVAVRTIYRDIDTLSLAGIPLYTSKGKNGGISLLEDFVLDKSLLSSREKSELLSALRGAVTVHSSETGELLTKLQGLFQQESADWIEIDYSDWSGQQDQWFPRLKEAVLKRNVVTFTYHNGMGETAVRRVEPWKLYFKHRAWYLRGFCLDKNQERMFKLLRIRELSVTESSFKSHALTELEEMPEDSRAPEVRIKLRLAPEAAYRVYDEFKEEDISIQEDGSFLVETGYMAGEWIFSLVQSFGPYGELLSPKWMRREIKRRLEENIKLYNRENIV